MDTNIFREPTTEERRDYTNIFGTKKDPRVRFRAKLSEEKDKCIKAGKPFAFKPALDTFNETIESQLKASKRRHGYIKVEDIKIPEVDLTQFSDLKNFELVAEGERADEYLTKTNPGLNVKIKFKKYKFKGYDADAYIVMEDPSEAIKRAQKERSK